MNYNIQAEFPVPLFSTGLDRGLRSGELDRARALLGHKQVNQGNFFTPNMQVLADRAFSDINAFLVSALDIYVNQIFAAANGLKLSISQSWLNINPPGAYHHQHTHPNSVISGVFYFETTGADDCIKFEKNYSPWLIETNKQNPFNIENLHVMVKPGQLLLFPSSLIHSVPKNVSTQDRISLSFNTMFKGKVNTSAGCALSI